MGAGDGPKLGYLVELINRHGEDIEYDLFERGWDLLDWFRGDRPWSQLLRLVHRLPNHSSYKAAILDDDEFARQSVQAGMKDSGRKTMLGFTPEVAALMDLTGWVKNLYGLTHAVNSDGKYPDLPATAYPETAFDRLRKSQFIERHHQRVTMLLGN